MAEVDFFEVTQKITFKTRVRRFLNGLVNLKYEIKGFFRPFNVVKMHNLPRTWNDRTDVLFHVMFQVLVDYVELEQPYVNWGDQVSGRFTDYNAMLAVVEQKYGPNNTEPEWNPDFYAVAYLTNKEILWLYKWYKNREWDKDSFATWEEEKAHIAECDDKLHRIVAFRGHYWT